MTRLLQLGACSGRQGVCNIGRKDEATSLGPLPLTGVLPDLVASLPSPHLAPYQCSVGSWLAATLPPSLAPLPVFCWIMAASLALSAARARTRAISSFERTSSVVRGLDGDRCQRGTPRGLCSSMEEGGAGEGAKRIL